MGFLFGIGSANKAAKQQAQATLTAANMQANNDRLVAQAAVQSQQTMIAQKQASDKAAALLSVPQGQVDVQLANDANSPTIDPTTGKRRTSRTPFLSSAPASSGVRI